MGAYLVSVFEEDVDSVVVAHELGDPSREGVRFSLELVHPVTFIILIILKGLSSPWMLKMSSLKPASLGQTLYMGRVLVARWTKRECSANAKRALPG